MHTYIHLDMISEDEQALEATQSPEAQNLRCLAPHQTCEDIRILSHRNLLVLASSMDVCY